MKKVSAIFVMVLIALMVTQPMIAFAGSSTRLIPAGTVSVLAEGKEVNRFKSEMPMPQGLMMACNGNCIIQNQTLQLVARDQAVFALTEADARWDLTIKTGRIDFALRGEAKPVSFNTPHDTIQSEQIIVPAGSDGLVRGFVSVNESGTELSVQEGALRVAGRDGAQMVQPGHSIMLAQARVMPNANAAGSAGKPTTPAGTPGGKPSTPTPSGAGSSGLAGDAQLGLGIAVAGVAGITAGAAYLATSGGDSDNVSPR